MKSPPRRRTTDGARSDSIKAALNISAATPSERGERPQHGGGRSVGPVIGSSWRPGMEFRGSTVTDS